MISAALNSALRKRVLFVGETIHDVYHYGMMLQRSAKEPVLVLQYQETELFDGGVLAASSHARDLCEYVEVASWRSLRKERFLERSHVRKLFEVCYTGDVASEPDISYGSYDLVCVLDYGHGMMTGEVIERICRDAKFLAVNVQVNASNYGFNLATKYPGADYLCMDELEARLATQNQHGPIEDSLNALTDHGFAKIAVTLGKDGAVGFENNVIYRAPAQTDKVVDTMGAGDAFFAITALVADTLPMKQLLRLGNAAAALKTQIIGHRQPVTKEALLAALG